MALSGTHTEVDVGTRGLQERTGWEREEQIGESKHRVGLELLEVIRMAHVAMEKGWAHVGPVMASVGTGNPAWRCMVR
jgi:hypothetical protein